MFICNYGLAGNLIGSQMYEIGDPCSKCPAGTKCSENYPGLCTGTPNVPLKIRRPRPLKPEQTALLGSNRPIKPNLKPELISTLIEPPKVKELNFTCIHMCRKNGGCSVKLKTNRIVSGAILGN